MRIGEEVRGTGKNKKMICMIQLILRKLLKSQSCNLSDLYAKRVGSGRDGHRLDEAKYAHDVTISLVTIYPSFHSSCLTLPCKSCCEKLHQNQYGQPSGLKLDTKWLLFDDLSLHEKRYFIIRNHHSFTHDSSGNAVNAIKCPSFHLARFHSLSLNL